MDFALTPDAGPPRVIRFVESGALPGASILSVLDKEQNLLLINKELYERLDRVERHRALRTHEPALEYRPARPSLAA